MDPIAPTAWSTAPPNWPTPPTPDWLSSASATTSTNAHSELTSEAYTLRGTTPVEAILRTACQHALAHGAIDIDTRILSEPTLRALLRLAATAAPDLIITADLCRSTPLARLLSDTPTELARRAHCDILIATTQ